MLYGTNSFGLCEVLHGKRVRWNENCGQPHCMGNGHLVYCMLCTPVDWCRSWLSGNFGAGCLLRESCGWSGRDRNCASCFQARLSSGRAFV